MFAVELLRIWDLRNVFPSFLPHKRGICGIKLEVLVVQVVRGLVGITFLPGDDVLSPVHHHSVL